MSRRRQKGPALPGAIDAAQAGELDRARQVLRSGLEKCAMPEELPTSFLSQLE